MRRCVYALAIAALALAASACNREADENEDKRAGGISANDDQIAALNLKVADIDKRLKKIEDLLSDLLNQPPEPDPAATYSVPIAGDPYVGPEVAKVTLVEAWDYS